MKVVLSTVGRFHMFALARELERHGMLECIYSGFTWSALKREAVARNRVRIFPLVRPILMAGRHLGYNLPASTAEIIHHLSLLTQDAYVNVSLPDCDVFVGHEGVGLGSGVHAQKKGALYVCDRGCTHIGWKEALLQEEYDRVGLKYPGRPRTHDREIAEYGQADLIVVPSSFARSSFVEAGVPAGKLAVVPYGVNLDNFAPVSDRSRSDFQVLFVGGLSVRKGAHDLFAAFDRLCHPNKRLVIAGAIAPDIASALSDAFGREEVVVLGPIPHLQLKTIMGESHALVLPSIEDGFGMVLAEALACGCPIVSTTNTGAADLIDNEVEGFIVPIRSPDAIAERLQQLADGPELQRSMSDAAIKRMHTLGGWRDYGDTMVKVYETALTQMRSGD